MWVAETSGANVPDTIYNTIQIVFKPSSFIEFHFLKSRNAVILTCTSGMGLVMKETARMTMAETPKRMIAK